MTKPKKRKAPYLAERWRGPGTPRLLLVDDDDVMRRSSVRFLARAGFEVVSLGSGAEALALLDEQPDLHLDAAVIDLEMPEMDGIELMRELKARRPELPMGLWSASPRLEELSDEELALAWFVKPKMRPIGELVQAVSWAVYGQRTPVESNGGGHRQKNGSGGNGFRNGSGHGNGSSEARAPSQSGFFVRRSSETAAAAAG